MSIHTKNFLDDMMIAAVTVGFLVLVGLSQVSCTLCSQSRPGPPPLSSCKEACTTEFNTVCQQNGWKPECTTQYNECIKECN